MGKKTRSPLHGATRRELGAIRSLVTSQLHWENALGTSTQYLRPHDSAEVLGNVSYSVVLRVRDRGYRRWEQMPHFKDSHQTYLDQHLRQYNRGAWEQQQLRTEVSKLRDELCCLKRDRAS